MTWLTWRQHRIEFIVVMASTLLVAALTAAYAQYAHEIRLALGVDTCIPLPTGNANCSELSQEWIRRVGSARYIFLIYYLVPALVASFLGGPLIARELERGTHRLAWTQGISRVRWTATKLGVAFVFVLASGIVLALVGGQTRYLMGTSSHRPWDTFDLEGPAFVSFMVFGLAVGAFLGAWRRQILAGMFLGLLAFGLVRGVVIFWLRPDYQPPVAVAYTGASVFPSYGGNSNAIPSHAWWISAEAIDDEGRVVSPDRVSQLLDEYSRTCRAGQHCDAVAYLEDHGIHQRILYPPADRYWRFQWEEAAIYAALSAALGAGAIVLLKRRDA